jgi:hypothetical protein
MSQKSTVLFNRDFGKKNANGLIFDNLPLSLLTKKRDKGRVCLPSKAMREKSFRNGILLTQAVLVYSTLI